MSLELGISACSWNKYKEDSSSLGLGLTDCEAHPSCLCAGNTVCPERIPSCLGYQFSAAIFLRGFRNSLYRVFEFSLKTWKVEWNALYYSWSLATFLGSGNDEDFLLVFHANSLCVLLA